MSERPQRRAEPDAATRQQAIDKVRYDKDAKGPKWIGANGKHYPSSSKAAESFLR